MIKVVLLNIFAFSAITIVLVFNPHLSRRVDGFTIKTNQASFYIPTDKSNKVYVFNPKPNDLKNLIDQALNQSDSKIGVVVKNLSTGQEISVNAEEVFNSASLYKLAVMYTLYEKNNKRLLDINKEDIKSNLYQMITVSSNEAAYYLVDNYASWKEVTASMRSIGLTKTNLNQNPIVTSPSDIAKLLEMIAKGEAVDFESSTKMLELLSKQKVNDRIPVYLPPTTIVAHKTGELGDVRHDAGVVITPENNYVLVLMSKDSDHPEAVKPEMAELSQKIHEFFATQWANPPEIL